MITCSEMKELERAADQAGLTYYQMMENAGGGAADEIMSRCPIPGKNILLLCGRGNNGGDGYVVARRLFAFGGFCTVALIEGTPTSPEAMANYDLCREMELPMISCGENEDSSVLSEAVKKADIIVDALYGTGFHGDLKESIRSFIEEVNRAKGTKVSLDLPSGLSGDNGSGPVGPHVDADLTVTFHDIKPIHKNPLACLGEVHIVSIGIDQGRPSDLPY